MFDIGILLNFHKPFYLDRIKWFMEIQYITYAIELIELSFQNKYRLPNNIKNQNNNFYSFESKFKF